MSALDPLRTFTAWPIARQMWSPSKRTVGMTAAAMVIVYAAGLCLVLRGVDGVVGLTLWTTSPLAVPVLIAALARTPRVRLFAAVLLATLWIVGALLLLWGLVLDPGDDHHLVVLFLPIYLFAFTAAAAVALGAIALIRAVVRRGAG